MPAAQRQRARLLVLIAITLAAALALKRLNLPNPFVIGIAAGSGAADRVRHRTVGHPQLDEPCRPAADRGLAGCALREFPHTAPRFLSGVVLYTVLALLLSALFGWGLSAPSGVHPATAILGTTPGGIAEMCITAKVLELACHWSPPSM